MDHFSVPLVKIKDIKPHPNADNLQLAYVLGYQCIIRKGVFTTGQTVAYIPEDSIVPENILKYLGFWNEDKNQGNLYGSTHNRVKAVKLRGEISQGILFPYTGKLGTDLKEKLGITKYTPPVPIQMNGEVTAGLPGSTLSFDIESYLRYPEVLIPGEPVVYTEKLHGTFCGIGFSTNKVEYSFGEKLNITIFSKGLGKQGLVFRNNEKNEKNLYVRTIAKILPNIDSISNYREGSGFILGEITGKGVQDLTYDGKVQFRAFAVIKQDAYRGNQFLDFQYAKEFTDIIGVPFVPVLAREGFREERLFELGQGTSTLGGCLREGVVVVPEHDREVPGMGRVALKYKGEAYIMRHKSTEYT